MICKPVLGKTISGSLVLAFILALFCFLNISSCVGKSKASPNCSLNEKEGLEGTEEWQRKFAKHLCEHGGEGWALFDSGGFAGVGEFGHIFVFKDAGGVKVYHATLAEIRKNRGEEKLLKELRGVDEAPITAFFKSVEESSKGLQSQWETVFDAFEREFVYAKKGDEGVEIVQRVKWRFGREKCEKHCDLEDAFRALLPKRNGKN